jgi:hypothetical protein
MSTTPDDCDQVVAPVGPYTGGFTSRISRFDEHGHRTTVANHLPSSQTSPALGSLVSGVADVAFIDGRLYAITAGSGCSHGLKGTSNAVLRIHRNGTWKQVANLSKYQMTHPTAVIEPDDFEPDGTWYSMISVFGGLFAVEPNHGELVLVLPNGLILRVADISASQGHIVPTVVAYRRGNFYVGNLGTFPITGGASKILKISPSGHVSVVATGFDTILGLTFDRHGHLYILENTVGQPGPTPDSGRIIRLDKDGSRHTVVTGLSLPTGMTFGPEGKLYVSNLGFGLPPGMGQILKISLPRCHDHHDPEDED